MIDLSERILQTPRAPQITSPQRRWHPLRRALQVLSGMLLVVLPLTNGLRLDVRRDQFYFAWHRMAAHDLVLLFWVAMLGVWALVAISLLYGRLWCGSICPQTLASDFADSVKSRLERGFRRRLSKRWGPRKAVGASRAAWALTMLAMAWGTGTLLACYWLSPPTVAHAAVYPLSDVPAALAVYGLAAVLAADLLWVRRKFCSHACPYGALMSLLADKNTLAVRYLDERDDDCIRCGKCVTDCPMGIDIKQGVGQLSCIGCGECVDACSDVLGKRGIPGLIELRYGVEPERAARSLSLAQRWGLWDSKRLAVVGTLFAFLGVVLWNVFGHQPLAVSLIAKGAITRDAGFGRNTYLLTIANGTPDSQVYAIIIEGMPAARLATSRTIRVGARDTRTVAVTVAVPVGTLHVNSRAALRLRLEAQGQRAFASTFFYMP